MAWVRPLITTGTLRLPQPAVPRNELEHGLHRGRDGTCESAVVSTAASRSKAWKRRTAKARLLELSLEFAVKELAQPVDEDTDPGPRAQVHPLLLPCAEVDRHATVELHRDAPRGKEEKGVERDLQRGTEGRVSFAHTREEQGDQRTSLASRRNGLVVTCLLKNVMNGDANLVSSNNSDDGWRKTRPVGRDQSAPRGCLLRGAGRATHPRARRT